MAAKDLFTFTGTDGIEYSLTLKEKAFCEAYLDHRGNGVKAAIKAGYKVKNRLVAAAIATENLSKPHIFQYVALKLEEYGFTDAGVEKQHLFLLNQHADLKSKAKAVDMFYKRRGAYAPTKLEVYDPNDDLSDEELEAALREKQGKSASKSENKTPRKSA